MAHGSVPSVEMSTRIEEARVMAWNYLVMHRNLVPTLKNNLAFRSDFMQLLERWQP